MSEDVAAELARLKTEVAELKAKVARSSQHSWWTGKVGAGLVAVWLPVFALVHQYFASKHDHDLAKKRHDGEQALATRKQEAEQALALRQEQHRIQDAYLQKLADDPKQSLRILRYLAEVGSEAAVTSWARGELARTTESLESDLKEVKTQLAQTGATLGDRVRAVPASKLDYDAFAEKLATSGQDVPGHKMSRNRLDQARTLQQALAVSGARPPALPTDSDQLRPVLYNEALLLTTKLSQSSPSSLTWKRDVERFWDLYKGDIVAVENGEVEAAMARFVQALSAAERGQQPGAMKEAAHQLALAMKRHLGP